MSLNVIDTGLMTLNLFLQSLGEMENQSDSEKECGKYIEMIKSKHFFITSKILIERLIT